MRDPLSEIPLYMFTASERKSLKRPLSPSAAPLSPIKRRILSAEGISTPSSRRQHTPSKQLFSEFTAGRQNLTGNPDFSVLRGPPYLPQDVYSGDASPSDAPVSRPTRGPRLQPSPRISSISSPDTLVNGSRESPSHIPGDPSLLSFLTPRKIHRSADPQSMHWPGFDVHVDTKSVPFADIIACTTNGMDASEMDDEKENARAKKRLGKRAMVDNDGPIKSPSRILDSKESDHISLASPPSQTAPIPQEILQKRKKMRTIMKQELDNEVAVGAQI